MSMFLVGAGISANNVDARDAVVVSTAVGTTADRLLGRAHHRVADLPVLDPATLVPRITPSLAKGSFFHRVGDATFLVRDVVGSPLPSQVLLVKWMEDYEKFNPEAPRVKTALARLYMYRWPFSLASESQERAGKPVIKARGAPSAVMDSHILAQ